MKNKFNKYVIPDKIKRLEKFPIQVKTIVEGFITGTHKSPNHGFSVEFKDHKQYYPGDDLKYIDWRVLAKTDKVYIKRFEEESNLYINIFLDVSKSMDFNFSADRVNKLEYAKYLAGALLYLSVLQKDSAGISLFSKKNIKSYLPKNSFSYVNDVLNELASVKSKGESDFKLNFINLTKNIKKKSLIIIISDFIGDISDIVEGIKYIKSKKNDIILFSINDDAEKNFPFKGNVKFIDMENSDSININSTFFKEKYRENYLKHYKLLKSFALKSNIDFFQFYTDTDFDKLLYSYLIWRNSIIS